MSKNIWLVFAKEHSNTKITIHLGLSTTMYTYIAMYPWHILILIF